MSILSSSSSELNQHQMSTVQSPLKISDQTSDSNHNQPKNVLHSLVKTFNNLFKKRETIAKVEKVVDRIKNLSLNFHEFCDHDNLNVLPDQCSSSDECSNHSSQYESSANSAELSAASFDQHLEEYLMNRRSPNGSTNDDKFSKLVRTLNSRHLRSGIRNSTTPIEPIESFPSLLSSDTTSIEVVNQTDQKRLEELIQDINNLKLPFTHQVNRQQIESQQLSSSLFQSSQELSISQGEQKKPEDILADRLREIGAKEKICFYCGLDNPVFVIKCLKCSVWFCNGKGHISTAHILNHMSHSGHKEFDFKLPQNSGNQQSCNICDSRDISNLGYITSSRARRFLICRPPCRCIVEVIENDKKILREQTVHENFQEYFAALDAKFPHLFITGKNELTADSSNYDQQYPALSQECANIKNWKPLIDSSRQLSELILNKPNRSKGIKCKSVTRQEIEVLDRKLLSLMLQDEHEIDLDNLILEPRLMPDCKPVLLYFENGTEYRETFHELLRVEKNFKDDDTLGDKIVFDRLKEALKLFEENKAKINQNIYNIILGKEKIIPSQFDEDQDLNQYTAPNLYAVNQSQAEALQHALDNTFTLIQGPPGTGKTHLAATLVFNLKQKFPEKSDKMLITAPSNIAADHLAAKIQQTGLKVMRLLSRSKEKDENYHSPLSIHHRLKRPNMNVEIEAPLATFLEIVDVKHGKLTKAIVKRWNQLKNKLMNAIFDESDVVITTCVTSADSRLMGRKFNCLLVDEVAQATEPEILIPLTKGVQKVILIGDQKQLSPVIKNKMVAAAGLDQSLFQRLVVLGNTTFMLNKQYRMHPFISNFSRTKFYDNLLEDGVTEHDRLLSTVRFKFPDPKKPIFFFSCKEEEQVSANSVSYLNRQEGSVIGKIVFKLVKSGFRPDQIGIITPYEGQREYLRTSLKFFSRSVDYDKIEIASINAYQGREKDIIIISTVRSNSFKGRRSIGFLSDSRRLNVALTRAKYGMILIGDHQTLANEPVWHELLQFYHENGVLFKGNVDNMKHLDFNIVKPPGIDGDKGSRLESNYHIKLEIDDDENPGERKVILHKIKFFD